MTRRESPARAGALLDGYALVARRSDQGLGDTWLAQRPHADDECIVKFVGPALGEGPTAELPPRFSDTLRKAAGASSPGLVALRRWGVHEGWIYVMTEAVEARSLDDWLQGLRDANHRAPPSVALALFDTLCGAVQSAHRQGVSHHALSPRSVLLHALSPGLYHGWILDLGLAPWITAAAKVAAVDAPSLHHLAPEQLDAKGVADARADVFALALLLVELLTLTVTPGSVSREPLGLVVKREHAQLAGHLAKLRDDVPAEFWHAVVDALHPDPARRPDSAQALKSRVRTAAHRAALWSDVPDAMPEPPTPRRITGDGDGPSQVRAWSSLPEGWQQPERLAPTASPDALKSMLSVAARRRRASQYTSSMPALTPPTAPTPREDPVMTAPSPWSPPPSQAPHRDAPTAPTPWSFADDAQSDSTVRSPALAAPVRAIEPIAHDDEGTVRRASLPTPAPDYNPDATMLPDQAWYGRPSLPAPPAASPASPPRRSLRMTLGVGDVVHSSFATDAAPSTATIIPGTSRTSRPSPAPSPPAPAPPSPAPPGHDLFDVDATIRPSRVGPIVETVDVGVIAAPLASAGPVRPVPGDAARVLPPPRPLTMPPAARPAAMPIHWAPAPLEATAPAATQPSPWAPAPGAPIAPLAPAPAAMAAPPRPHRAAKHKIVLMAIAIVAVAVLVAIALLTLTPSG